jgi:hypothetical protein
MADQHTTPELQALLDRAVAMAGDEVVTEARLQLVDLPLGAGTMGLITLDNGHDHTRPNTFGPKSLASLNTALDEALSRDDVVALGVTGKPFILAAGADLSSVRISSRGGGSSRGAGRSSRRGGGVTSSSSSSSTTSSAQAACGPASASRIATAADRAMP